MLAPSWNQPVSQDWGKVVVGRCWRQVGTNLSARIGVKSLLGGVGAKFGIDVWVGALGAERSREDGWGRVGGRGRVGTLHTERSREDAALDWDRWAVCGRTRQDGGWGRVGRSGAERPREDAAVTARKPCSGVPGLTLFLTKLTPPSTGFYGAYIGFAGASLCANQPIGFIVSGVFLARLRPPKLETACGET